MKLFSNINKMSIKNIIASRAYCSNFANEIGNEFIMDCPYQIITSIRNSNTDMNVHVLGIELSLFIAFVVYSYYYYKVIVVPNNTIQRLYEFIDYQEIQMQTRNLFIVITIVLFRNVQNAI